MKTLNRKIMFSCGALIILGFVSTLLTSGVVHGDEFTLYVDAHNNCLEVDDYWGDKKADGGTPAYLDSIDSGSWEVSIESIDANYDDGDVKKVALFYPTRGDPFGWFNVVSDGKKTMITLPFATHVTAFFPDFNCSDNRGGAFLKITKIDDDDNGAVKGFNAITASGHRGTIWTITYEGKTYHLPSDLALGKTAIYDADGNEHQSKYPPPGADDFSFNKTVHSTDGLAYLETMFRELHDTFFVFENGGNDDATWYGIKADGTLTRGIEVNANVTALSTPYKTGFGKYLHGYVFETPVLVKGIRIEGKGFDACSISAVP